MNDFTKEGLQKLITILKKDVPAGTSDYCLGYHYTLMVIQRWLDGKDPWSIDIIGLTVKRRDKADE